MTTLETKGFQVSKGRRPLDSGEAVAAFKVGLGSCGLLAPVSPAEEIEVLLKG